MDEDAKSTGTNELRGSDVKQQQDGGEMRLWRIQDLFDDIHEKYPKAKKYVRLIHVCIRCQWKTLAPTPLDINANEIPLRPPKDFEIRNLGVCDTCNQQFWRHVKDELEE